MAISVADNLNKPTPMTGAGRCYIDGVIQDCSITTVLSMEIL